MEKNAATTRISTYTTKEMKINNKTKQKKIKKIGITKLLEEIK